jgi:hydrogenase maturation protease
MTPPILVLAVGNPSRGDDAFGPLLAEQLQAWLAQQPTAMRDLVEVIVDQQLVVEHMLDLQGRSHVLFVDAAAQCQQGDQIVALQAVPIALATQADQVAMPTISTHSSTPAQLLALHQSLLGTAPPPADLLTLTGHGFELGQPLSDRARLHMPRAWQALQQWLLNAITMQQGAP